MTTTVTDSVLRTLSGFRAENGCAISLYIDLDPSSTPTAPDVVTKFNALLSELEKEAEARGTDRDCRLALRDDLARIRAWFEDQFDRDGTKGVAIFASSADGEFRALALPEAVGDLTRIGSEFVVAPLAGQLGRDGALVAVLSRERGNVYRFSGGRLVEVVDESEETQGQHSQGGWSQARYQRHIEHLVQQHLKTVGQEIDRRTRGAAGLELVIVAPEELRNEIEGTLSAEAREALIGWTTAEAHAGPNELLEVVRPLLDEARARSEEEELERWEEEHGRGGRAAAGWKQTLEAASDGRVAVLLLDESSGGHQAWLCPRCGRASADGGKCPLDDTKLEQTPDGADLAVHRTVAHGGTVVRLGAGALGDAAGIGAILRY
jgi:peptide chain release factor subunit 1